MYFFSLYSICCWILHYIFVFLVISVMGGLLSGFVTEKQVLFQNSQWGPTAAHHPYTKTLETESGGKENEPFI